MMTAKVLGSSVLRNPWPGELKRQQAQLPDASSSRSSFSSAVLRANSVPAVLNLES
jgi:hypothetical protein